MKRCGRMSMNRMLAALAFAALALGGCATHPYDAQMRASIDAPYQLASGDRLRVIVFGQDNLTNSFNVDGAGNIAMPLIGLGPRAGPDDRRSWRPRWRRGCAAAICAIRKFPSKSRLSGRSSCSAKSARSGQYPFRQRHDGADGGRHRRRLFAARRPERRRRDAHDRRQRAVTSSVPLTFPIRPGDTITVRERFF